MSYPSSPPPHHELAEGAVSETLQGEFDCHRREERERWKYLPSKYKGYEALLSAVPDATVVVPKGGPIVGMYVEEGGRGRWSVAVFILLASWPYR